MLKRIFLAALLSVASLLIVLPAQAFETRTGNTVHIGQDEEVKGNLYAAGQTITIDTKITGDVICAAQTVNINAPVAGDVICAGQTININDEVGGNVRLAGSSLNINNEIEKNAMAFGASVLLSKEATVGWEMTIGAASAEIHGKIGRGLHGGGANTLISGEIGGDVDLTLDGNKDQSRSGLVITKDAIINGQINYKDTQKANIAAEAQIKGDVKQTVPDLKKDKKKKSTDFGQAGFLFSVLSSIIIGLLLITFFKPFIAKLFEKMASKTGACFGWGALLLIATPIVAIMIMITIIGIPLGLILLLVYGLALYLGKVLASIYIGKKILETLIPAKTYHLAWALVVGVILLQIIFFIPVLGCLVCLAVILWGFGGLFLAYRNKA